MSWPKRLFLGAVFALPGAACSGRTELDGEGGNPPALFVRQVLALGPGECLAKPNPASTFMLKGALDLDLRSRYDAAILVANTLPADFDAITLDRASVVIRSPDGKVGSTKQVLTGGFVEPRTAESYGWGVASVQLLDAADIATLVPQSAIQDGGTFTLSAEIRVEGAALNGKRYVSAPFQYPIDVCSGCLVSYPTEADEPAEPGYQCSAWLSSELDEPPPCQLGQDYWVDCRFCVATVPTCSAPQ